MKVVLQVVTKANVIIDNKVYNEINNGYMLLVGIGKEDNEEKIREMANKISKLRVCADENGKTNLDIHATNGQILSISQFTLYANTKGSNRPDFLNAAGKDKAIYLYDLFNRELRDNNIVVKEGIFGADMKVNLENDGPFTILLDN